MYRALGLIKLNNQLSRRAPCCCVSPRVVVSKKHWIEQIDLWPASWAESLFGTQQAPPSAGIDQDQAKRRGVFPYPGSTRVHTGCPVVVVVAVVWPVVRGEAAGDNTSKGAIVVSIVATKDVNCAHTLTYDEPPCLYARLHEKRMGRGRRAPRGVPVARPRRSSLRHGPRCFWFGAGGRMPEERRTALPAVGSERGDHQSPSWIVRSTSRQVRCTSTSYGTT
jgi:hypothetical protein